MGIYDRAYYKSESRTNNSRASSSNGRMSESEEEFFKTAKIGMGVIAGTVVVTTAAAVGLGVYLIKKLCD